MIGDNPLRVAKNHGHAVQTMLEAYAAWIEGAQESDSEAMGAPRTRAEFGTDLALRSGDPEGEPRVDQENDWRRESDP
jgi:hypothetical protein